MSFEPPEPTEIEVPVKPPQRSDEGKSIFDFSPEDFGLPPTTPQVQQTNDSPKVASPHRKKDNKSMSSEPTLLKREKRQQHFKEEELNSNISSENSIEIHQNKIGSPFKKKDNPLEIPNLKHLKPGSPLKDRRRSTITYATKTKEDILSILQKPVSKFSTPIKQNVIEPTVPTLKFGKGNTKGHSSSESLSEKNDLKRAEIDKIIINVLPAIEEVGEHLALTESRMSSKMGKSDHDPDVSPQESNKSATGIQSPTKRGDNNILKVGENKKLTRVSDQLSNEDSKGSSLQNISLADGSHSSAEYRRRVMKKKNSKHKSTKVKKSMFNRMLNRE